jgi:aryl-alcohol dehydrogenase-like predicted oxidoreductase
MTIGLGTVQFGLDYGILNRDGKTPPSEVEKIIAVATDCGIRVIDTAESYGDSEKVLGNVLGENQVFDIVTKTRRFTSVERTQRAHLLEETLFQSLQNMRRSSVYGLLIHHADDLTGDSGNMLMEKMVSLKQRGFTKKIGVSVYTAEQIERIMEKFTIDLIQVPVNVLDQRLILGGHLARLKASGVEIHSRSVFLQGLLLMNPTTVPPQFDSVRRHLIRYHEMLRNHSLTPLQGALGFVAGINEIDVIICGVNNHSQLAEICSSSITLGIDQFTCFAISDEDVLNPSRWHY